MKKIYIASIITLCLIAAGCSTPRTRPCGGPGDLPQDHFIAGMEALDAGQIETARGKFERSAHCDADYSPAYGGLAIVHASGVSRYGDPAHALVEHKKAADLLKLESKKMRSYEDEMLHYLAVMRTASAAGQKGWFDEAEAAYNRAKRMVIPGRMLPYYGPAASLDYFMGVACRKDQKTERARGLFADAVRAGKESRWLERADRAWKETDDFERASTGDALGATGQTMSRLDRLTRRDIAVLLVNEFGIAKLFAGRLSSGEQKDAPGFQPADITLDPFCSEVLTVLRYGIRGLECAYNPSSGAYLFRPDEVVTRADMALILEDIIIKVTGDEGIATAYLGHGVSPFSDVRPTSPVYNAVMLVTTRGIMEPQLSGSFMADRPVSGAQAVLAVRTLKQKLHAR